MLGPLRNWLRTIKPSPPIARYIVVEAGVAVCRGDQPEEVLFYWDEIEAIETYKVDLFTFDDIRLRFRIGPAAHELSEEIAGFVDVMSAMQNQFPSIAPDWHLTVMFPAFATNHRVLWVRATSPIG
jgi:hypothetical protein